MRESMKPSQLRCSSPTQEHSLKFALALPNPPAHPSDEYALVHQSDPEDDAMALRHSVPPLSEVLALHKLSFDRSASTLTDPLLKAQKFRNITCPFYTSRKMVPRPLRARRPIHQVYR